MDLICAFLISMIDLIYPMITRNMINTVVPNKDIQLIVKLGIILLFIYIIRLGLRYFVGYYGHLVGVKMEYDMRKDIFKHIEHLSFNFFDNAKTGNIMSRVVNDLFDIAEVAHHAPEDMFLSVIKIVGSFILLFMINWKLTLIVFAIMPFMFYFMYSYNSKLKDSFTDYRASVAEVNGKVEENVTGIRVVKSFTNEHYEIDKFDEDSRYMADKRRITVKHIGVFDAGVDFFSNIDMLIALVFGGYFVAKGMINTGDFVAFVIYISQFLNPLQTFLRSIEQFQQGMAGFRRFIEVMEKKPDIVDKPGASELLNVQGRISFDNVKFSYSNKKEILSGINLNVKKGETIAIVGPSGAGKTTLCSLLPRFYDIDDGCIKIDDTDIRDVTIKSLRENIGIVQQDVFLFAGTIKENISYGKLDATDEEIIDAAKAANAHDFIMSLSNGYDTYIGERGVKLSGGQKQRISIARMFLKNPPVLILDEATSSLDNESEKIIQNSIEELSKNRTTFIIAHRLTTIRNADRIVVLTEKGIEEVGTHKELLESKKTYYNLYYSQFEV